MTPEELHAAKQYILYNLTPGSQHESGAIGVLSAILNSNYRTVAATIAQERKRANLG